MRECQPITQCAGLSGWGGAVALAVSILRLVFYHSSGSNKRGGVGSGLLVRVEHTGNALLEPEGCRIPSFLSPRIVPALSNRDFRIIRRNSYLRKERG